MTSIRTSITAAAILCLGLATTACGQQTTSTAPGDLATPASSSSTTSAAGSAASAGTEAEADQGEPATSAEPAAREEGASAAQPTATTTVTETASAAPAPSRKAAEKAVVASDYKGVGGAGAGHYFTSGSLLCGITPTMAGCQSTAPVTNVPECNDMNSKAPLVALVASEPGGNCTSQGVFVAEQGRAHELPAGQKLTVDGTTCQVLSVGSVTCTNHLGTVVASPERFSFTMA